MSVIAVEKYSTGTESVAISEAGGDRPREAIRWFTLAIAALAVSGVLSLVLVVGRVPVISSLLIHDPEFARRCLVVHVNLAISVWFYAFLAGLFRLLPARQSLIPPSIALGCATLGTIGLTFSVFLPSGTPITSNYIPALDHGLFCAALALFAVGIVLSFMDGRLFSRPRNTDFIPTGAHAALLMTVPAFVLALLTIAGSWYRGDPTGNPEVYFERLFWGGGHVLQVVNTLGLLLSWLILLRLLIQHTTFSRQIAVPLFGVMLLPIAFGPWITFGGHSSYWFTRMMEFGLFPVTLIILIVGAASLWLRRSRVTWDDLLTPGFIGLVTSVAMTLAGFVLGAMITTDTTLIPAHYHANIGAVTVAYMAVLLSLLPRLGSPLPWPRVTAWQPLFYGVGQMVFVIGLAVAGTLGQASRKTYGVQQQINTTSEQTGLIIVGIGGILAFGGGVHFIVVMVRAALHARRGKLETPH